MMDVKINGYVDTNDITESVAIANALAMIESVDTVNGDVNNVDVLTKLYYIVPKLDKLLVVVSVADQATLGVSSQVLANTNITSYPMVKLPSQLVEYKELVVKVGTTLSATQIIDAAQYIADTASIDVYPYKLPIVKVIDYNNTNTSDLILPTDFHTVPFSIVGLPVGDAIVVTGDATAGESVFTAPATATTAGIDLTVETKILASAGLASDNFGCSVSVSDTRIVVGAYGDSVSGSYSGAAYIFDISGNQLAKIQASDSTAGVKFGTSVAVSNTCIVVGASSDSSLRTQGGAAYIFDLNGNQLHKIHADIPIAKAKFGANVAASDTHIVIGAIGLSTTSSPGAAYIFDISGNQLAKIQASDAQNNNQFGASVAVSDTRVVVGAYNVNTSGSIAGAAYIYDLNGNQLAKLQSSDIQAGDEFGKSVAVSSTHIAVGAVGESTKGSFAGAAYIFDIDGAELIKLMPSDISGQFNFGIAVSINDMYVTVGTSHQQAGSSIAGYVYVFDTAGNQVNKIQSNGILDNDYYGSSLDISGTRMVVGASGESTNGSYAGAAYIYG